MSIDYSKINDDKGFDLKLKSYELESLVKLLESSALDANLSQVYADLKLYLFLNYRADDKDSEKGLFQTDESGISFMFD